MATEKGIKSEEIKNSRPNWLARVMLPLLQRMVNRLSGSTRQEVQQLIEHQEELVKAPNPQQIEPATELQDQHLETPPEQQALARRIQTQADILRAIHPQLEGICSSSFMEVSASSYPMEWKVREFVQGYVDQNPPPNKGTLNGVDLSIQKQENGRTRIEIDAPWKWEDITGAIELHSDKEGITNAAGGNGIGLKKAILLLTRDIPGTHCRVEGWGWAVDYDILKKENANNVLESKGEQVRMRHDWFVAKVTDIEKTDRNKLIIETDSQELINGFKDFYQMAPGENNTHLKNPDVQNQYGSLKWLLPEEGQEAPMGRLYMNGQVFAYGESKSKEPWDNLQGVCLALHEVDYSRTLDRPALNRWDLSNYVHHVVNEMSPEEKEQQIVQSEPLWKGKAIDGRHTTGAETAAMVLIEKLVDELKYDRTLQPTMPAVDEDGNMIEAKRAQGMPEALSGNTYAYCDQTMNQRDLAELKKQKIIICPYFFEKLGIPKASSFLQIERKEQDTINKGPDIQAYKKAKIEVMKKHGIQLGYEALEDAEDIEKIWALLLNQLRHCITAVEEIRPGEFRCTLKNLFESMELLEEPLYSPSGRNERINEIRQIRGLIVQLENVSNSVRLRIKGKGEQLYRSKKNRKTEEIELYCSSYPWEWTESTALEFSVKKISDAQYIREKAAHWQEEVTAMGQQASGSAKPTAEGGALAANGSTSQRARPKPNRWQRAVSRVKKAVGIGQKKEKASKAEEDLANLITKVQEDANRKFGKKESQRSKIADWVEAGMEGGIAVAGGTFLAVEGLRKIMEGSSNAKIKKGDNQKETAKSRLANMFKAAAANLEDEDQVEFEEIYENPSKRQKQMMLTLMGYFERATGVTVHNTFFVYKGKGSKGVNVGKKAIGLHEALLEVDFEEANRTFIHEIAHNIGNGHNNEWRHMQASLMAKLEAVQYELARKQSEGEMLTEEDRELLEWRARWEKLRTGNVEQQAALI